ncbi:MAG: hypothetical protein FJ134_03920 [Deltaproteobacteria bacterium]|nr:hypothetical protein [Deltaproteobacteria bacterium]
MINIAANSAIDLLAKLKAIEINVPPRKKGRNTEHCERWSICRFLATYAETNLIQYPMRVEKREKPDFLISLPSTRIGIEVTEAVPPDWAWANARRENFIGSNLIFLQSFQPGGPRMSKMEVDNIASGANRGDGWVGDAPEKEWAEAMAYFSLQKADKFLKSEYERFDVNWLLIYDNWPLPAVEYLTGADYFLQWLGTLDTPLPFDSLFVECADSILHFKVPSYAPQPIRDLWKNV